MIKIAYLILAHTDCKQVIRLINALNYKCDFYIHIDLKSNISEFEELKKIENVFFVKRVNVNWAGFSMVIATKNLIEEALNKKVQYSHLVLLSGADYPIKSKEYIYNFFIENRKVEFIRAFKIADSEECYIKQIKRNFYNDINIKNIFIKKIIRKLLYYMNYFFSKKDYIELGNNEKIYPCFGSQWWALTPECCRYIMDSVSSNKEIDEYFRNSFSPDEKYFHTMVFNSVFSKNSSNNGIEQYIKKGTYLMANLHIIDPSLSKWFNVEDFNYIKESKQLFVRKVNTKESSELLDLIDENILNKVEKEVVK